MSACCSQSTKKTPCPACGHESRQVSLKTLLQQLKFPRQLELQPQAYYFCSHLACEIGYFSSTDSIKKSELSSYPQIKEDYLCYCFNISMHDYTTALQTQTESQLIHFVTEHSKNSLCACEVRNPSGQCCLSRFKRLENNNE